MGTTWAGRLAAVLGIIGLPLLVGADGPAASQTSPPTSATSSSQATAEVIADPEATPVDTAALRDELTKRLKDTSDKTGKNATPIIPKPVRDVLEDRLRLLDEWDKALKARREAEHPEPTPERQVAEIKTDLATIKATLSQTAKDPSILLPAAFRHPASEVNEAVANEMKEAIEAAKIEVKEWKTKLEKLRGVEATRSTTSTIASIRSERDQIHQRVAALTPRRKELEANLAAAKSADEKTLATERLANFEWESRVETERLLLQDARITLEMKLLGFPDLNKQACDAHVSLSSKKLGAMQGRYQTLANSLEHELKKDADAEQTRADRSDDPLERYQARCKAQLLELRAQVIKHEKLLASSPSPSPEEQRNLADRADTDFENIKSLLDDGRVSRLDTLKFNTNFRRIGPERAKIISRDLAMASQQLNFFENLLSSVEFDLINDKRIDQYEHETLLEQLPAQRHEKAKAIFTDLDAQHEELLMKNRAVLTRLASRAELTQTEIERRLRILDDQYGFIRTHIFWVRDQEPLGFATFVLAQRGSYIALKSMLRLAFELGDRSLWGRISAEFLTASFFLLALPYPLYRLRAYLRSKPSAAEICPSTTWVLSCRILLLGVASSLLWPSYCVLLAYVARQAPWPRNVAFPMASVFLMLAPAMSFVSFTRWLFRSEGWAEKQLRVPQDVTRQFARASLVMALVGAPLAILHVLFDQSLIAPGGRPVVVPSVTRLLGLGIELLLWGVVFYLTRGKSNVMQWLLQLPERFGWLSRRRRAICATWLVALGGIVVLDTIGYSFTAQRLTMATGQVIVLVAVCWVVYRLFLRLIDQHAWRWIRVGGSVAAADAPSDAANPADLANRLRQVVAYLVPVGGLLAAAWMWDIDWALFEFVGNLQLFRVDDKATITVGNVTQCAIMITFTAAIWHHMSTFFAVAIFPRMSDDPGIRFAVVTLSRYAVLAVGLLAAFSTIHLGVEKIGMVLAALGVGLGFGLQEIVSNFVCGIILLLERPIRVGDTVTVSGMSGKVDRINIRATTIINGDNQSIIVPNRAFVTSDLVNWTLKDKIIRVSIRMRVSHGTDPDRVSDLLLKIAREDADVLRNPMPASFMEDFCDSALTFVLHVHVPDPSLGSRVRHRLFSQIQKRFAESGIEIPVPTHELRVHPLPESASRALPPVGEFVRRDEAATMPPAPKFASSQVPIPAPLDDCHRGVDE